MILSRMSRRTGEPDPVLSSQMAPEAYWSLSLPGYVNPPWRGVIRRDASLSVPHLKLEAFLIPLFCPIRVRTPFKHHMTRCLPDLARRLLSF